VSPGKNSEAFSEVRQNIVGTMRGDMQGLHLSCGHVWTRAVHHINNLILTPEKPTEIHSGFLLLILFILSVTGSTITVGSSGQEKDYKYTKW